MKAIEITTPGEICLSERPDVTLDSGKVLLKVDRIGYCGSDLAAFRGINPLVSYPRVPGHEIGATVLEIGSDANTDVQGGDRVLVIPYANCGECAACHLGRPNCCAKNDTLGVQVDGALCEYFQAPPGKLISSSTLSHAQLALVEPLTVGFHAVARSQVTAKDTVAVFGCGAIGLGVITGAAYEGARVIAIDIDDRKLQKGKACGAAEVVNSMNDDLHERLQALTDGHGPNVCVEAVGLPACYRAAVEEVAQAGRVTYIGWSKGSVEYNTTPFVFKELDIRGSRNAQPADFAKVVAMLEEGKFPLNEVITRTVSIDDAPSAMVEWDQDPGKITKIHIELDRV